MTIFESQISTPVPMPMRMTPFKRFKKNLISYMKINVDIGPNKKTIICLLKKKHDVVKFVF